MQRAKAIQRATSRLRGLRVRRKIKMGAMTRVQILRHVERKLMEDYSETEIEAEGAVLKALGLLPAPLDYKSTVLSLLKDQVAGFYDPKTATLNLADWIPMDLQEPALAHEICHALQDQHFKLKRIIRPLKDNSDQQLAQAALLEGDCTGVMLEYMLRSQGIDLGTMPDRMADLARQSMVGQGGALHKAPLFLRETMFFPYLHGLELMQEIRSRHPWSRVNLMYKRLPASTEQILHSGKYWRRERPVSVRVGRRMPALDGYRLIKEDVLGEFQLSLLLRGGVSIDVARRAAAGWGGDRLAAFRKEGSTAPLLVHLSSWDSDADALEYVNALRHTLASRGLTLKSGPPAGTWIYLDAAGQQWLVQLNGPHILMLGMVPESIRGALQREVWQSWRVAGRRVTPTPPVPGSGG